MTRRKKIAIVLLSLTVSVCLLTYFCNRAITGSAKDKMYTDLNAIPFNKTGLLLGTSKFVSSGRNNQYYDYRIQSTIKLINAHKIKYIIISGDNGRKEYNEPELMRSDLIAAGVDSSVIFLDYAGFRTFDSIKRLKEIFGQDSVTIISQQFHNERAIYIAGREGISAIGFNAQDVGSKQGFKTQLREKFARVKVFLDYWIGTKPKYLGDKVKIPS
jgi:SanA protein